MAKIKTKTFNRKLIRGTIQIIIKSKHSSVVDIVGR